MRRTLLALMLAAPLPAMAQDSPKVPISTSLLEEIYRVLSSQPYSTVATTITKLQTEVQQQQKVSPPAPEMQPPPPPAISKEHKPVPN
jgi:hypothetical protein